MSAVRPERAYEVTEKAVAYRTYVVFAETAEKAKAKVRNAEAEPHWANTHDDGYSPVIVLAKRAPAYDGTQGTTIHGWRADQ